jgi:hypothetical protein
VFGGVGLGVRDGFGLLATALADVQHHIHRRHQPDEHERCPGQRLPDDIERTRERIAEQHAAGSPDQAAGHVPGDEGAVTHARHSRHRRDEGPEDRGQSAEQDGLTAMSMDESVDCGPPVLADPDTDPRATQARSELLAELEADAVAGHGADEGDGDHQWQVEVAALAEHPGDEQGGLAGQHHADENRCLGEAQAARDEVHPGADRIRDRLGQVLEHPGIVARSQRCRLPLLRCWPCD